MPDQRVQRSSAQRPRRAIALARLGALVGAALVLAACGNDATPGGGAGNAASGGVTTRDDPKLGKILTTSSGAALYFADQEADGKIRCAGDCLNFWTPMMASGSASAGQIDGLGMTRREPEGNQLTFQGKPLYTFKLDSSPGQVTGDKVEDDFSGTHFVWHAAVIGGQPSGGDTQAPSQTTTSDGYGY